MASNEQSQPERSRLSARVCCINCVAGVETVSPRNALHAARSDLKWIQLADPEFQASGAPDKCESPGCLAPFRGGGTWAGRGRAGDDDTGSANSGGEPARRSSTSILCIGARKAVIICGAMPIRCVGDCGVCPPTPELPHHTERSGALWRGSPHRVNASSCIRPSRGLAVFELNATGA